MNSNDIILYEKVCCPNELLQQIEIIATHTQNTWQQGRSLDDIIKDTTIGKISEYILKDHIARNSNYAILDYDDFRVDHYRKHAPLDCIIFEKNNTKLPSAIDAINLDAKENSNGAINESTKEFLNNSRIFTMEIKSTRLTNRHKRNGKVDYETILNDDFLAYPKFCRRLPSNIQVGDWDWYLKYCKNNNKIQSNTDLITLQKIELDNMYNYYARVYVEQIDNNLFDVYIIGYIPKQNFINSSVIKRMPQSGKSECALYIATKIKNGIRFKR